MSYSTRPRASKVSGKAAGFHRHAHAVGVQFSPLGRVVMLGLIHDSYVCPRWRVEGGAGGLPPVPMVCAARCYFFFGAGGGGVLRHHTSEMLSFPEMFGLLVLHRSSTRWVFACIYGFTRVNSRCSFRS